ncbi:MAG: hypothetical protein ACK5O7_00080 [Holosporales bacterium]
MPTYAFRTSMYALLLLPNLLFASKPSLPEDQEDLKAQFTAFWHVARPALESLEDNDDDAEVWAEEELKGLWIANHPFLQRIWNDDHFSSTLQLQRLIAVTKPLFDQDEQKIYFNFSSQDHFNAPHHHLYTEGVQALIAGDPINSWQKLLMFSENPEHAHDRGNFRISGDYPSPSALELSPPVSGLATLASSDPELTQGRFIAVLQEAASNPNLPTNELQLFHGFLREHLKQQSKAAHRNHPQGTMPSLQVLALKSFLRVLELRLEQQKAK